MLYDDERDKVADWDEDDVKPVVIEEPEVEEEDDITAVL